ncbi:MAG: thioredoxin family protein [Leeuwenhoekiella sp.]
MIINQYIVLIGLTLTVHFSAIAQDWHTDFTEAKEVAVAEHKPILLVFQGSDWCAPCIKLEREIWSTEAFKDYAKDHYVMLKADFPRKKKNALEQQQQNKNSALAAKYNVEGYFPLVVVLDQNGKVRGKTGYKNLTPEEYIKSLNSF